jgi:hypothetical protein
VLAVVHPTGNVIVQPAELVASHVALKVPPAVCVTVTVIFSVDVGGSPQQSVGANV